MFKVVLQRLLSLFGEAGGDCDLPCGENEGQAFHVQGQSVCLNKPVA